MLGTMISDKLSESATYSLPNEMNDIVIKFG